MKNTLTILLLLAATVSLSAQIQKGSLMLGGTVGFNYLGADGDGATSVNVTPNLGYFISDQIAIGSSLGFALVVSDGESSSAFGLSPFGRYYNNGTGRNRFFGQVKIGVLTGDSDFADDSAAWLFGLGIGADFFLNDNVAIEALLGYQRLYYPEYEAGLNNIGLNFGVAAFISRNQ